MNLAARLEPLHNLSANVLRLMNSIKISEAELARQTGIPQPTLHKILSRKTNDPRASTLRLLADYFGISIDDLLNGTVAGSHQKMMTAHIQSLAVISWQNCIDAENFLKKLTPTNWHHWAVSELVSSQAFGLVSKPSMEPRFPRGTVLLIDPTVEPEDGDIAAVHYPNTQEATLRITTSDGPSKLLISLCPNAITTPMDDNIKILGVLVQTIFSFQNSASY